MVGYVAIRGNGDAGLIRDESGHRRRLIARMLLSLVAVVSFDVEAGVMVAPTRIVLEADQRAGEVFVINQGNEPITARISLVNRHMREDGSFAEAAAPVAGEYFADGLLQYAPRRVRLAPGEGQTVRVLARPPTDAPAGEYRSHLLFRVEPTALSTPIDIAQREDAVDGKRELSIRLVPIYGVSIPVIVRTGQVSGTATIAAVSITNQLGHPPSATFRLHRSGNASVYGDVRLLFQPAHGTELLIGEALGLAVYTPLPMRIVSVPFNRLEGASLPPGRLRVQFVDHHDGSRILAEAETIVP